MTTKRIAGLVAAGVALLGPPARAEEMPAPFTTFPKNVDREPMTATEPEFFNGLGTKGRRWSVETNTSFDTNRVFTERFELAVAIPIKPISPLVTAVARASFGGNADTVSGFYGIQGPILSLGLRDRSKSANYWVEFGLRMLPNYSSPHDTEPSAQQAAFRSTLSSGIADDAAWLPLSSFGAELYAAFQSRTDPWRMLHTSIFYFGAMYGGNASLAPLAVKTWLGPQNGFVGNLFLEIFLGVPELAGWQGNLQFGAHGEASLSSIWPGNQPFPALVNGFVAWSPKSWFALRVFAGVSGSPLGGGIDNQYGTRLAFFVP